MAGSEFGDMVGTAQGRLCPPYDPDDGARPETLRYLPRNCLMRAPFLTLGILAFLIGLLWVGQGTGTVNWPRSSFMIQQTQWAWYGAALALVGMVLIWMSRR
jgi:hypothetical protein